MVQIWTKLMHIWMFWGYFINNLDFGFGGIEISMVCRGWVVRVWVKVIGMVMVMVGVVGRLKLVGLCTKAGRLTACRKFLPKMEIISRNHPLQNEYYSPDNVYYHVN